MNRYMRAVGIDLGTTNSALAVLAPDGSETWIWEDRFKRKTYPSVVGLDASHTRIMTGWDAWNRRGMAPYPITSVKRVMGTGRAVTLGERSLLPEEASSEILKGLTASARAFLEGKSEDFEVGFDQAVITVPAYFDAPQIEATRKAGELAGLKVLSLVQEPTAAAMYYAWKHGIGDGTFLVYDLGGGTFDVSIIRSMHGEYQVLGIDGDNFLGGDDFDKRLAEHFRKHLVQVGYDLDLDIANNPDDVVRFFLLSKVAQEVKESLSTSEVQYVARRDIFVDHQNNPVTLELEFSREEFDALIQDLVEQSIQCCHNAILRSFERGNVSLADIEHVLLVGGSTHVPLVKRRVEDAFCRGQSKATHSLQDEPDTCVALGASVYAATFGGLDVVVPEGRLHITSQTYTHEPEIDLNAALSLSEDIAEHVRTVALINQAEDVVSLVRPVPTDSGDLRIEFEEIRLADEGTHRFRMECCDADGDPVATFEVPIYRGRPESYKPAGSALSNLTVLAKELYLEVVRDGRVDRQLLIGRGTSLPTIGDFRFFTADRSGAVILRLYQNRYPIRTIHLSVPPDTELGTPVDLRLKVDETMTMVAEGEVLGQKFWAQIEPAAPRELRGWEDVERLLNDVDQVARHLWGNEARYFRNATDPLISGIREAARTDTEKLQALLVRLEDVLDTYRNRDLALTPAWERMEILLNAIKRVVYRGDGKRQLGLSTDEWTQKLEALEQNGRNAYTSADQTTWTQIFNQVQAIWESLSQDEYRFSAHSNPQQHVDELKSTLRAVIDELRSDIHAFAVSPNIETAEIQRRELEKLRAELTERVDLPLERLEAAELSPAKAKPELDRLFETAHFVRKKLEKLPTLGLVSR